MLLREDLTAVMLHREGTFSFYPYCFYDRDNGCVDLYLVIISFIVIHQSLQFELL